MPHIVKVHSIQKDHKKLLHFEYDDNSQQDYSIIANGNNERTINKDDKTYCLIENQEQVNKRLNANNFAFCIFLIKIDFNHKKFEMVIDFSSAIFTQTANFSYTTFIKDANFSYAIFTQAANFSPVIFTQDAIFICATFTQDANFSFTTFTQGAYFGSATFTQDTNFSFATFVKVLDFTGFETIKLSLQNATVKTVVYANCEFQSDNRETFLVLKNVALKQNDQIRALEFHTHEHQKYLENLKWKKNFSDKFILYFECLTSNFGTSVKRSLFSLLGLIAIFYLAINGFNLDAKSLVNFILPSSYSIDTVFSCGVDWWDRWLFLLYKILQLVLIYEIIKSFRKFSRTL